MANQAFVDSVMEETIRPGFEQLMGLRYFVELRSGKLSIKRLQGWALHMVHFKIAKLEGIYNAYA